MNSYLITILVLATFAVSRNEQDTLRAAFIMPWSELRLESEQRLVGH